MGRRWAIYLCVGRIQTAFPHWKRTCEFKLFIFLQNQEDTPMRQQEILQVKRKSALWILALVLLLFSAPVTEAEEIAVVACPEGGVVQLVDLETNTVIDEIKVGLFPGNLVVDKNGDYAYIAGALSFDITILNVRTRQIEGKIAVGFVPTGLALTPDGKYLLVANSIKGRPHEGETEESPRSEE